MSNAGRTPRKRRWPRCQHVIFDCDSTLTAVEGIDVLARDPAVRSQIEALTRAAMEGEVNLSEIYGRRLAMLQPTHRQVHAIRSAYKQYVVADARELIHYLLSCGHDVYIVSGGLIEPVREFGIWLGVPPENIRAVEVEYDELSPEWWLPDKKWERPYRSYQPTPLADSAGKLGVVQNLLERRHGRRLLVGDGHSDLAARPAVDLFVGFGGVECRARVRDEADVFIECASLAAVSCLASGSDAIEGSEGSALPSLVQRGLSQIRDGRVRFRDAAVRSLFVTEESAT